MVDIIFRAILKEVGFVRREFENSFIRNPILFKNLILKFI